MRTKGSAAELEVRRRIANNLLSAGSSRAEVARLVGASWTSVDRWRRAFEHGGPDALASKPHPGRRSRLTDSQQKRVVQILERGALASGFSNDLWTCPRVAEVIEEDAGIGYEESYVWRLLHKWGWSCQRPRHRAREQVAAAVERWKVYEWPRIKKGAPRQS